MKKRMTAAEGSTVERPAERQFTITRVLSAPRALVFKAWTEAERLMSWWGPKNFTVPYCKVDLRPGGVFHYCMRSPEGKDYWGRGVYREVTEPERLVYNDSFSDEKGGAVAPEKYGMSPDWPAETLLTVTFEDRGIRTRMTINLGVSEELAKKQKADQGWNQSLDRLEEYLAKERVK